MEKEIYLAGGCFWGIEKYIESINGVIETEVGYANGNTENPTYEEVCSGLTEHAEAVKVVYDSEKISLEFLLKLFYDVIDPTSMNRQGMDIGTQYRSGVYYTNEDDRDIIVESINELQKKYTDLVVVEVGTLDNYYKAEEEHQKYLDKNPRGYCHIGSTEFEKAGKAVDPNKNKQS